MPKVTEARCEAPIPSVLFHAGKAPLEGDSVVRVENPCGAVDANLADDVPAQIEYLVLKASLDGQFTEDDGCVGAEADPHRG